MPEQRNRRKMGAKRIPGREKVPEKFWTWKDKAETGERVLYLNGTIAEASWYDDDVTPEMFRGELFGAEGPITVWINSPGGDCVAAAQIYNMLIDYKGDVTVKIDGLAASAASVIAMAGTRVLMSPVSTMMIHNPATIAFGNSAEMQKAIDMLASVKESIMNAYEIKTGMDRDENSRLMDEETWMDAGKAVELGFADGILEREDTTDEMPRVSMLFSREVINSSLLEKMAEKCRIEEPGKADEKCRMEEAEKSVEKCRIEEPEKAEEGRPAEEIRERLNFIRKFI